MLQFYEAEPGERAEVKPLALLPNLPAYFLTAHSPGLNRSREGAHEQERDARGISRSFMMKGLDRGVRFAAESSIRRAVVDASFLQAQLHFTPKCRGEATGA